MKEHFLNYEQSLAVKELGFPQNDYFAWFDSKNNVYFDNDYESAYYSPTCCSSPLKSQFFKWVREKGYKPNIVNDVSASKDGFYYFDLWLSGQILWETDYVFDTYEQAEDACINKIIELLKLK